MFFQNFTVAFGEDKGGAGRDVNMPPRRSTPKILHRAGELRKQTTPAEKKLWLYLRLMQEDGVRFRRQHAIGNYVVDFCAPRKKLIIELDGSQHLKQQEYDACSTEYLESRGYRVIRFWNNEVIHNIEGVLLAILQKFEEQPGK